MLPSDHLFHSDRATRDTHIGEDIAVSRNTLWCKQTFQQCFSHEQCVLFPLQQQLFDFLDVNGAATRTKDGAPDWLPFSIEFPSELEVSQRLSVHTRSGSVVPLFSSACSVDCGERVGAKRRQREHYNLLYGTGGLSSQTRMFLATTFAGLERLFRLIEPLQRHLYEIIRADTPCHLYFDVEREIDYVGVCDEIVVSGDDESSVEINSLDPDDDGFGVGEQKHRIVTAELPRDIGDKGQRTFRMPVGKYATLLEGAAEIPMDHCRLDCALRADNTDVDVTLLRELRQFCACNYPDLVAPSDSEAHPAAAFEEVIVMRSATAHAPSATPPTGNTKQSRKFSQHYVIKLKGHCFKDAAAAGEFVLQFVEYLHHRAAECSAVHRKLFFHGPPVALSVLREVPSDYNSSAVPFFPRKCLIDTAVYSRNRMMRCLGCCKLNKDAILRVEKLWQAGIAQPVPSDAECEKIAFLVRTLIALPACVFSGRDRVPVVVPERRSKGTLSVAEPISSLGVPDMEATVQAALAAELSHVYAKICGKSCSIGPAKQCGSHHLVLPITGTRFCQCVQREHRSNNVYFVVDTETMTAVQKCFDPDCAHFRSPAISLLSLTGG